MQSIILAAGMGKRLGELTRDCTKSMVKVNGITIIERMLRQLDELSLSRIIILIGYEGEKLKSFIKGLKVKTELVFIENPVYYKTNNIYSLFLGKEYLVEEDTILLESDLVFEEAVLKKLIKEPTGSLVLVDKFRSWMDGTCVTIDEENRIKKFVSKREFDFKEIENYYKTVNIYLFKKEFSEHHYVPFLEAYCKALGDNEYYEQVLKVVTLLDHPGIKAMPLNGGKWYEIDDAADLDIAESMFSEGIEKQNKIHSRYGGFWRYPDLIDFCYLVNPLFPPKKLMEEMKSVLSELMLNYPSGSSVIKLLTAKNFKISKDYLCVGNGAAEIIKALMPELKGKVGILQPSFEEYMNLLDAENVVAFPVQELDKNYHYTEEDIIRYFEKRSIKNLIIVNPENPSGNYIGKKGILRLLEWTRERDMRLILDESFMDFAETGNADSCILKEILEGNKQLVIIKSISKAHGIPGLRLGFMVTADKELSERLDQKLPIWNINSLAEFYLQIFGKYENEFEVALGAFKHLRAEMGEVLRGISWLEVLPTQANYFMCRVKAPYTALSLTVKLLNDHNLLIKDLSNKKSMSGEWVRLAIKTKEENEELLRALKSL